MAGPKIIKSLERGLLVLQALQMQPDSSLHELYVFTGISKPSLLRILHTLARSGLVTRRLADRRYRIGATLSHAPSRREHRDRIAEAAAPILERLRQRVSWPSDLMVPAGDHMEIRETTRARSPILLQQERIGLPVNWLQSAVGRAYLAYCPAKERQRFVDLLRNSTRPEAGARSDEIERCARRGSRTRLWDTGCRAYRRLLRRPSTCRWPVLDCGSLARRLAGFGRNQHALAQDGIFDRGVRGPSPCRPAAGGGRDRERTPKTSKT
jgi:DNA-binding IclR family transcriptional regulator